MSLAATAQAWSGLQTGLPQAKRMLRLVFRKPLGTISLVVVVLLLLVTLFAEVAAPYDPLAVNRAEVMKPPSSSYWLGTDNLGRDLLSRLIYGARVSLTVGIAAVVIGVLVGTVLGIISGYFGGTVDLLIQRYVDAQMAFPALILALAILAALGPGLFNVILAIGIAGIPRVTRVVRSSVLVEKESSYVEAARIVGCDPPRIMLRHLLPNVQAPLLVMTTSYVGTAITAEAAMSFLGLGVPPPTPSWGGMLSGAHRTYMLVAPWMAIFPGVAITIAVLAFNLLGDAARDLLDPRLRD
jgi:ABC-type dipeptide/oligopeptide/nickel transport system permease subunit